MDENILISIQVFTFQFTDASCKFLYFTFPWVKFRLNLVRSISFLIFATSIDSTVDLFVVFTIIMDSTLNPITVTHKFQTYEFQFQAMIHCNPKYPFINKWSNQNTFKIDQNVQIQFNFFSSVITFDLVRFYVSITFTHSTFGSRNRNIIWWLIASTIAYANWIKNSNVVNRALCWWFDINT